MAPHPGELTYLSACTGIGGRGLPMSNPKPRVGRPRLSAEGKAQRITFSLEPELTRKVRKAGDENLSAWISEACREKIEREETP